jgi:predicted nuclease of predicted toxin-antitoxin system
MRFLIDAQLPRRFSDWLADAGHDALHTLDLPLKNQTPDTEIVAQAKQDGRIVVSKDDDFVQAFLLRGEPHLLLISTGNSSNAELEKLMRNNLSAIEAALSENRFVEINRDALVIHE